MTKEKKFGNLEERHYEQWKVRPKELKKEMAKDVFKTLKGQHDLLES